MKNITRSLAAALTFCIASGTMGQWGVQGTLLHYEPLTGRQVLNWTVGFVHDPSPRTSIALELVGHLNLTFDADDIIYTNYAGYSVLYEIEKKSIGMQYRSSYFLTGENGGLYLGPSIGFRRLSRTVSPEAYSTGNSTVIPAWSRRRTEVATLVPLALRMGYRSEMDGWFMDLYVAVGSTVGAGTDPLNAPYLEDKDKLRPFLLQLGYAIGLGW
jgi:hypothetical protein